MNNDIIDFCNKTDTVYGILDIFKNEFLTEFCHYKPKERPPILKAIPYLYRLWFYSVLMLDTTISPSSFINSQIKQEYSEDFRVVPIITPVFKNRVLRDFKFEFKTFSVENHPVLEDLQIFIEHCIPDVAVDENGLLLEVERDELINCLTFKEIFYATFLTNLAYSLNLIEKMPSINTYRAMANRIRIESFFKLSAYEQLQKIIDTVIGTASKSLSSLFEFDRKAFSKESLMKLFQDSQNLEEYSRNTFKKYNLDIGDLDLEDLYFSAIENGEELNIPEETLIALSINVEFNFIMDAQLLTPLGHYLQVIQPIYNEEMVFQFHFAQLLEAYNTNVPPIKLYFFMGSGFDITSLGKKILLGGKSPKNIFQELESPYNYQVMYNELISYYDSDEILDGDFGDFNLSDEELNKLINEFRDILTPIKENANKSASSKTSHKSLITKPNLAYTFKVKHYYNKRSWKAIELKGTQTLDNLANSIVSAFDLEYGSQYSFFMNNKAWDKEFEITSPYNTEKKDMAINYKIHKLKLHEKQKLLFLYDFNEEIKFEIEFTVARPLDKTIDYPRVVKSSRDYTK
ncbi:plasmid pRiA4b ORF-3 family protein [Clostridium swellfunianum]|uniref:plasmid pRiA4b ORF-3 family protein n=1 Tax=Clostridium swellfunianum TaxID=1367462 RepID=UPI00202E40FE|nr:plasmid pRiA4b ORF-3 family protein [Clostridium swellfunianum]MCM0647963.1 plasmid pRiA4b ORF-3 family protein [Clostridium swellfunianum]